MRLTCPACNAEFTLDVLLAHEGARTAVATALVLPAPLGRLVLRYLGMWRTGARQLSWDRVAAILSELQPMIEAGQIERNGRAWAAPQDYWIQALTQMVQLADSGKLKPPLKSHGYLLEIIVGMADKQQGKAETADHRARATGLQALPDVPAHGMAVGDCVEIINGEYASHVGFIESAMPRFARVELAAINDFAELIGKGDFINVPWTSLAKVAKP